ncbi:hypothetical protein FRZ03_24805 [Streptomyces misionensis]|uniref:DUF6234 domain-containing protein n=1 Tax=Streptomyces misionensis TaxID=67331 RepID=A0A5C6J8L1_9ACTN|nr:DUF6234 family protein [Streptomyces misionensis]TWV37736.1 hypothetical protein FRZ03_24805 [Streptomyces misionensis]
MDLPVAPPAFDATTGPRAHRRADLGADVGVGCALLLLELIALAGIFWLWFLTGFELDPAETADAAPLWPYLSAVGAVGVVAIVATAIAARAGAVVTVVVQAVVVVLTAVIVFGGATAQSHQDLLCRDTPAAADCRHNGQNGHNDQSDQSGQNGWTE